MDKLDQEVIEQYLAGTLGEQQLKEVEARLAYDQEFREEVEFQQDVQRALLLKERTSTKNLLKTFDKEEEVIIQPVIGKPVRRRRIGNLAVAASFVLLAALAAVFSINSKKTSPDKLLSANFQPYENVVHQITRSEGDELLKDFAFNAYEAGNYETADSLLNELYKEDKDPAFLLYSGVSNLEMKNYDLATQRLRAFSESTEHPLYDVGNWYLALAYIGKGNIETAREILQDVDENDYNYKKAQKLIKKLD